MTDATKARPVKTTKTSLAVVRAVRESNGATLSALADRLGLAKSTVLNHVTTLCEEGFLVREGDTYHVGLAFMGFGEHARTREKRYAVARRLVYELAERTAHEADFIVEENGWAYSLEYAIGESTATPQDGSPFHAGNRFPLHACASGKAMLGAMSDDRVDAVLDGRELTAETERTITDREGLDRELARIRKRGYAVNDEELIPGYRSVGVAVPTDDGGVFGAFSVGGPAYRLSLDGETMGETVDALRDAVASLRRDE